jgi:DNA-directed RNA polymerase subunit RPC12/RpoP
MRLFRRKPPVDDAPRCPECRERIPDGAIECAMCGRDLRDVREQEGESAARA